MIDRFDAEMAEAIFDGFLKSVNRDKADFIKCFKEMLRSIADIQQDRLIITVRRSHLSSKVRAIVPVLQSHFDFACSLWTY